MIAILHSGRGYTIARRLKVRPATSPGPESAAISTPITDPPASLSLLPGSHVIHRRRFLTTSMPKAISYLPQKVIGEALHSRKTEFDIPAIVRDNGGAEEIIPHRQANAKVDAVRMAFRQVVGMMPDVHLGAVENLFHEGAQQQAAACGRNHHNAQLLKGGGIR